MSALVRAFASHLKLGVTAVLTVALVATPVASAADFGQGGMGTGDKAQGPNLTSEFIYRNDSEEALIPVYLLGAVTKPGLYHVPASMDVLGLLTVAGGTLPEAEIDHVLVRGGSANPHPRLVRFDLNQVVSGGDTQRVSLSSNDLVYVTPGKPSAPLSSTVLTIIGIAVGVLTVVSTSFLISQEARK